MDGHRSDGFDGDLRAVFPLDADALDAFVSLRLFEAGVWDSPRTSDGVALVRVVESEPSHLRASGEIYEIEDQSLHAFWLDLGRDDEGSLTWELSFDAIGPRRRARGAMYFDHSHDVDWRVVLAGRASWREGVIVAHAAERVIIRDGSTEE